MQRRVAAALLAAGAACAGPELTDTTRPGLPPPTPPEPPRITYLVTPAAADTSVIDGEYVLRQWVVVTNDRGRTVTAATVIFAATEGTIISSRVDVNQQGEAAAEWRIPDAVTISNLRACAKPPTAADCNPVHLLKWNRPGG